MNSTKWIAMTLLLAACGATIEVTPWRGAEPASILVVPTRRGAPHDELASLDRSFGDEIRRRGYSVVTGAIASDRLRSIGWVPEESDVADLPLAELAAAFAIDAVCIVDVDRWGIKSGPRRPFEYSIVCSIVSTRDESLLWLQRAEGAEPTVIRRAGIDPFADRDDPFQADNPVPWIVENEMLQPQDVGALIAQHLMSRLPVH